MGRQHVENGEKLWLDAFNAGDTSGVLAQYGANARLLPPNSDIVQGRAALEPFLQGFIDTGVKITFDLLTVHESAEVCTSVGRYEMTGPDGAQADSGKYIEVWVRQADNSWLIEDDMFNSSLPVPTG